MKIIQRIIEKLLNLLDYYEQTKDEDDLVSDIRELVVALQLGTLE